jgi:DNA adenine methylase
MVKARPFLKWAGGKSRLAKQISGFFPKEFNRYFEPFLGSGAIYFAISPQEGVLNDLNKYLIGVYEIIRDDPHSLIKELRRIDKEYHSLPSLDEKADCYYNARTRYNGIKIANIDKASLFIFLNKAGFNGMYRENSRGEYNIPFGKHDKCLICDEDNLLRVSNDLKKIKFTSADYKEPLKEARKGDLVYLDPPYVPLSNTANFTQYQKEGFGFDEQQRLRDIALELHKKGCFVVISNSDCDKSRSLYTDKVFIKHTVNVTRQIHSSKKIVSELVVTNFTAKGLS